mmetsp:Transcript_23076/g.30711  ORF Transcript_23076/g.30711 Transcript_23076/m.30711 type:complete len:127 (-) Transcript_23076:370-750(-)
MLSTTIAVLLTFVIYLGIYAFNNPDREAWVGLAAETNDRTLFRAHAELDASKAIQVVNIHSRFTAWFFWGFINWFAPLFIVTCAVLTCSINQFCGLVTISALSLASACSATAWFIVGAIWRFNKDG